MTTLIDLLRSSIKENDQLYFVCLLYTSDAADDMQCVDLGGRRIIKKISCTNYPFLSYQVATRIPFYVSMGYEKWYTPLLMAEYEKICAFET